MDERLRTFIDVFVIVGVIISLYFNVYVPQMETKPDLECHTISHYIGNNTAINAYLIRNKGNAAATNIGIYFELASPYTIKEIRCNIEYNLIECGEGYWIVKMTWDRLEPKNSLNVAILVEVDPFDITSIVPVSLKVWSDAGIIEEW